jgi:hypothetical protein
VLAEAGHRDEALTAAARALALDSASGGVRRQVGVTLVLLGEYRQAAIQLEAARRLIPPSSPLFLGALATADALAGQRERAAPIAADLARRAQSPCPRAGVSDPGLAAGARADRDEGLRHEGVGEDPPGRTTYEFGGVRQQLMALVVRWCVADYYDE